jgi:hypothetical protein
MKLTCIHLTTINGRTNYKIIFNLIIFNLIIFSLIIFSLIIFNLIIFNLISNKYYFIITITH